jgi:hypothetical protein
MKLSNHLHDAHPFFKKTVAQLVNRFLAAYGSEGLLRVGKADELADRCVLSYITPVHATTFLHSSCA